MTRYQVINETTGESHGIYDSLDEARGCVEFDRIEFYCIWHGDDIAEEHAPE